MKTADHLTEGALPAAALRRPMFGPGRSGDEDPMVRAKLAELHSRTVRYNRELAILARELAELRAAVAGRRPAA